MSDDELNPLDPHFGLPCPRLRVPMAIPDMPAYGGVTLRRCECGEWVRIVDDAVVERCCDVERQMRWLRAKRSGRLDFLNRTGRLTHGVGPDPRREK